MAPRRSADQVGGQGCRMAAKAVKKFAPLSAVCTGTVQANYRGGLDRQHCWRITQWMHNLLVHVVISDLIPRRMPARSV